MSANTRIVRILHISDLHFRYKTAWDSQLILSELTDDIKILTQRVGDIDRIAVTGDIAFAGSGKDYDQAINWINKSLLPSCNLNSQHLLLVPGNHDVDREKVTFGVKAIQKAILDAENHGDVAKVLSEDPERELILSRHSNYINFYNSFVEDEKNKTSVPWWSRVEEINGVSVHFAGISSAWMSHKQKEQGDLLIGRWQLMQVRPKEDVDVSMLLLHHPWEYIAEWDADRTRSFANSKFNLVLRGHLHKPELLGRVSQDSQVVEIAAGACYADSSFPNSYHLIEILPDENVINIYLRRWDKDKERWIADMNAVQDPQGKYQIKLFQRTLINSRSGHLNPDIRKGIARLSIQDIHPILQKILAHITRLPISSEPLLPVPQDKLEHNLLSEDCKTLLRAGMVRSKLLRRYFARRPDPTERDQIASVFRNKYQELRNSGLLPDDIFQELQTFVAGGETHSTVRSQAAVLAALSYFFEECDIFERTGAGQLMVPAK